MIDAYAADTVRGAEQAVLATLPDDRPDELMARAARGLATVVRARLKGRPRPSVVTLVGAGNNGGDALYASAQVARHGASVTVLLVADTAHAGGLEAVREAGIRVIQAIEPAGSGGGRLHPAALEVVGAAELVLDGILGIGGRPGLGEPVLSLVHAIPETAYVVAVDLPSGADPSGQIALAAAVFADETVTFGVAKPVHLLPATERAVGRLTVVDIGLSITTPPAVQRLTAGDAAALWPVPGPGDHKYSRGVVGIVAGGKEYTGAPLLAVTAAVCAGAGMVRYVGPERPTDLIRAAVPEAVFGVGRVQAWVVGPGLDIHDRSAAGMAQRDAAQSALDSGQPCVVDAGGLDLVAGRRSAPTLLTPHAGELARLLSRIDADVAREQVESEPLPHARRLADLTSSTVLLKGFTTLVVSPASAELPVRSQSDAPPWLATAGAGDVLAGLVGVLLAAGLSPLDAGSLAALVHGFSASAANPGGPIRALQVAHGIPAVVARLLRRAAGGR
jgi:hydroxyethylthiazole kinase-like uncharacterized protein yjeF